MDLDISARPHTPTLKPLHGMPPALERTMPFNSTTFSREPATEERLCSAKNTRFSLRKGIRPMPCSIS